MRELDSVWKERPERERASGDGTGSDSSVPLLVVPSGVPPDKWRSVSPARRHPVRAPSCRRLPGLLLLGYKKVYPRHRGDDDFPLACVRRLVAAAKVVLDVIGSN
ncbi:hypothetical protein E2C01_084115 [Portunus trituberculatus]|uniref:Uncharacterized protein n=1 Tax=Portunus trituberculatus TaxID=210409 RepID=A0A5B7IXE5_PORTR|nr:hypothetical protein [Portunus trituberculatus]